VDIKQELKDLTTRRKTVERLYTLYEIKHNFLETINKKIEKTEQDLVKLDMEVAKDGLERQETKVDK
jgi:hypothetical protein|tara:strand:+ start:791 stop:991 length:201 start_codon:yes stop_codon:yes gene_type:complete